MRIIKLIFLSCFLSTFFVSTAVCQWTRVMEYYGNILCFHTYSNAPARVDIFAGTNGGGVLFSNDYGTSWIVKGLTDTSVLCFASNEVGANIFAGTNGQGVKRSDNYGATWTTYNNGLTTEDGKTVRAIVTTPNGLGGINVFAGTDEGVFFSSNYGESWINKDLIYVNALAISDYGIGGARLYASSIGNGIFTSSDNGASWTKISNGVPYGTIWPIALSINESGDTTLFASCPLDYIYRSTNNGANWTLIDNNNGLKNSLVQAFAICPDAPENIFAGTGGGGVFLSTDNGTNWTEVNTNLTSTNVRSLIITSDGAGGKYLFAGTINGGIWRRPLADMITSVQVSKKDIPKTFKLFQNYPNPFNPRTTIHFLLPSKSHVTLRVYDILGQELETLINEEREAGMYILQYDGLNLTSGIYFYRLQAGSYSETKKLILLK